MLHTVYSRPHDGDRLFKRASHSLALVDLLCPAMMDSSSFDVTVAAIRIINQRKNVKNSKGH